MKFSAAYFVRVAVVLSLCASPLALQVAAQAATWTDPVVVAPGGIVKTDTDAAGRTAVVYNTRTEDDGPLNYRSVSPDGQLGPITVLVAKARAGDDRFDRHMGFDVDVNAAGQGVITWGDANNSNYVQRINPDGSLGAKYQLNSTACKGYYRQAKIDASGNITIAWQACALYVKRWLADGTKTPLRTVSSRSLVDADLAMNAKGSAYLTYVSSGHTYIRAISVTGGLGSLHDFAWVNAYLEEVRTAVDSERDLLLVLGGQSGHGVRGGVQVRRLSAGGSLGSGRWMHRYPLYPTIADAGPGTRYHDWLEVAVDRVGRGIVRDSSANGEFGFHRDHVAVVSSSGVVGTVHSLNGNGYSQSDSWTSHGIVMSPEGKAIVAWRVDGDLNKYQGRVITTAGWYGSVFDIGPAVQYVNALFVSGTVDRFVATYASSSMNLRVRTP